MKIISPLFIMMLSLSSCVFLNSDETSIGPGENGQGDTITIERNLKGFSEVSADGIINLKVKQGEWAPIKIKAEENLMDLIHTEVKGDVLKIWTDRKLKKTKGITVWVTAPDFNKLTISGASNLDTENTIQGDKIKFSISGAGDLNAMIDMDHVESRISGAGSANLSGKTGTLESEISGSGSVKSFKLTANQVKLDISGAGSAQVHAVEELDVSVSGAGSVKYRGNPKISKSISGAASIKKDA
ncbi:MAG: hypothetical protein ACI959_001212 [Limisphaerales bacterium]|jgi:hypothetical protein